MSTQRHGLSIGLERFEEDYIVTLKATGKLTHDDYEKITPIIDSALEGVKDARVRLLFDASEFSGWEIRAAWDDLKLDLKHGNKFDKIAFYGNRDWQKLASKVGSWFIAGEMEFFDNYDDAIDYLEKD